MNYRRGFNRLFVVFAVCWYVAAGFALVPKWYRALNARRYAEHIITSSPNPDGTYTAFEDEISTGSEGQTKPTTAGFKVSPMRFLAWDGAERKARALRPIKETISYGALPIGVYLLALALAWIVRGFRPKLSGAPI
jgi:hypothetical protein